MKTPPPHAKRVDTANAQRGFLSSGRGSRISLHGRQTSRGTCNKRQRQQRHQGTTRHAPHIGSDAREHGFPPRLSPHDESAARERWSQEDVCPFCESRGEPCSQSQVARKTNVDSLQINQQSIMPYICKTRVAILEYNDFREISRRERGARPMRPARTSYNSAPRRSSARYSS